MVFRAAVTASYDSALFIPGDQGAAGRTHGHGYTVEAVLEADALDESGFVVDFEKAQPLLDEVAAALDHRLLNELEPFADAVPSAERQAAYFFQRLSREVERGFGGRVRLTKVKVTQIPGAWAAYEA
jgi:6-pyruvoyltetrahydropterin/6-carboxytetrahydropterin synthase